MLDAAIAHDVTVAEVTYSNSISVSEHVVMMILTLVRNYLPSYRWVLRGGWNIADCVSRSYDLEGMQVGTVGAGPDEGPHLYLKIYAPISGQTPVPVAPLPWLRPRR